MTALADACAELAAWLPAAEALITAPDAQGSAGRGQPSSRPPWNAAAAMALLDAAEGARQLEASWRSGVLRPYSATGAVLAGRRPGRQVDDADPAAGRRRQGGTPPARRRHLPLLSLRHAPRLPPLRARGMPARCRGLPGRERQPAAGSRPPLPPRRHAPDRMARRAGDMSRNRKRTTGRIDPASLAAHASIRQEDQQVAP